MNIIESKTDRQERIPHFMQEAVRTATVAVIGAGATSNEVLKNLALMGFGYVHVSDMDHISTSNLSRTVLYTENDVGKRKASTAAQRYSEMNTEASGVADYYDGDICHGLGEGIIRHVDLVIGCVDNDQTRLYISDICKRLQKPYIDTGIGGSGFDWNVFPTSGKPDETCFACLLPKRGEEAALHRIRNSCDVTRRKAAAEGTIPTIVIPAAAVGAQAALEAVKIIHRLRNPDSQLFPPQFGIFTQFTAADNKLKNTEIPVRSDCDHHDSYERYGGVTETPMSARWTLRDALSWVKSKYGKEYGIALYKDNACSDRSFITKAFCEHCGKEIDVYRPQPLQDEDLLCESCRTAGLAPTMPSNATVKAMFTEADEDRLQEMTLKELGIPLLHILEFAPIDEEGNSLFLELTGDLAEVMPNLPG